jgi:hypothetical protein
VMQGSVLQDTGAACDEGGKECSRQEERGDGEWRVEGGPREKEYYLSVRASDTIIPFAYSSTDGSPYSRV